MEYSVLVFEESCASAAELQRLHGQPAATHSQILLE